jgi:hypothetical protein
MHRQSISVRLSSGAYGIKIRAWAARIPEVIISALLVLTSLVVSGFIFVKLDRRHSEYLLPKRSENPTCSVPDPLRHHAFKPKCEAISGWGRTTYTLYTNNLGLRDERIREVPLVVDVPRILLLGDSFTEGMLAWHETFAGMIADRFPQLRILNGGITSYSPSNYLMLTKQLLNANVQLDEVIVFLDISDIQDEAAYHRDNRETGVEGAANCIGSRTWTRDEDS